VGSRCRSPRPTLQQVWVSIDIHSFEILSTLKLELDTTIGSY
jgi:hypothetical protein